MGLIDIKYLPLSEFALIIWKIIRSFAVAFVIFLKIYNIIT